MNTNISATIKDLEQQKAKIDGAIASLKALSNGSSGRQGAKPTIIGVTLAQIKRFGPQTSEQVRSAILAAGVRATPASIQTIMSRRARMKKDLVHKGRGLWGVK